MFLATDARIRAPSPVRGAWRDEYSRKVAPLARADGLTPAVAATLADSPTRPAWRTLGRRLAALGPEYLLLLMCAVALWHGVATTGDLDWPFDADIFRDIGNAQAILDGHFWEDPAYRGEWRWYNPLVPTVIAGLAKVSGLPVHLLYTRGGAYLGLLAPLSFYLLVASLFGRWTAAASTLGFLFVTSENLVAWSTATYSPWLFAQVFVQALFYLTLTAYHRARTSARPRWFVVTGILLGATFLGHTAPALLLGGIIGLLTLVDRGVRQTRDGAGGAARWRHIGGELIAMGLPTLLISLPFLATIVGAYRLRVINTVPSHFIDDSLFLNVARTFLRQEFVALSSAFALYGLIAVARRRARPIRRGILLAWLGLGGAAVLYGYLWQFLQTRYAVEPPMVVPTFHFMFYLKALQAVFFGYGLSGVSALAVRGIARLAPPSWHGGAGAGRGPILERLVLVGLLLMCFVRAYPTYSGRHEFTGAPETAREVEKNFVVPVAFAWIRAHTGPTDVLLASDKQALFLAVAAGREVVVMNQYFSNPYVDWRSREIARTTMYRYLAIGKHEEFSALARRYGVTFVLASRKQAEDIDWGSAALLIKEAEIGDVVIYRLR